MEIVDAHVHFWSPKTHGWITEALRGGHSPFESIKNYSTKEYFDDVKEYKVAKCVHIQANWTAGNPTEETRWLSEIGASNEQGFPNAIVAYCDLSSPTANEELTSHKKLGHMVGVRQMLNYSPTRRDYSYAPHDDYLTNKDWIEGVGLLERHDLSFDLQILPHQVARAVDVVRQYPKVSFILDHLGLPFDRDSDSLAKWKEGLSMLATCPNVVAKVSGLWMFGSAEKSKTLSEFADVARTVVSVFGPHRCMFGSNFPLDRLNAPFGDLMETHLKITETFTQEEKDSYFGELAKKIYKLQ